jgi:hypothetical protein
MQRFTEGLKFGEDLLTARQGRQETEQLMGMRETAEARAASEFEMRRAEAERQRAQAEAGQAELMRLMDLGANATPEDYTRAYIANPAIRQDLSSLKTMLEAPRLETMLTTSRDLYAASKMGNVDAVRSQLTLQRDAAKNSGDQTAARAAEIQLEQLNTNPDAAMNAIAASSGLMVLDLKGPEYFKAVTEGLGFGGEQPTFRPATAEELAIYRAQAGQIDTKTGRFYPAEVPSGMTVRTTPEGGVELTQGPGVGGEGAGPRARDYLYTTDDRGLTVARPIAGTPAATEVQAQRGRIEAAIGISQDMLNTIESVVGRPAGGGQTGLPPAEALPGILGLIEGRLPAKTQAEADLLARVEQISGRAFLEAFEALKGAGQITEIEGTKATQALARLQRTQSPEAFQEALFEFSDIVRRGLARAQNELTILPEVAPAGDQGGQGAAPSGRIRYDANGNRIP